jgi:hypothetical protein
MSSFTPSPEDIITPETPRKNKSPLWSIITVVVVLFCCVCLCFGVLATWFIRFGITFLSGLFGS